MSDFLHTRLAICLSSFLPHRGESTHTCTQEQELIRALPGKLVRREARVDKGLERSASVSKREKMRKKRTAHREKKKQKQNDISHYIGTTSINLGNNKTS